ncbi:MAG: hypothetical protein ABEJ83_00525 [Candidatus Nanohaloarchaea archaeon]
MRKGQNLIELTPTLVFALIITTVFLMLNVGLYAMQHGQYVSQITESQLVTVSPNRIPELTRQSSDLRDTSALPRLILSSHYSGDKTVREKLQEYLYCSKHGLGGCSFDSSRLKSVADGLISRDYMITVGYRGETVSVDNVAVDFQASQGPSKYKLLVPAPGGDRIGFELVVSGYPQSLRWSK